LHRNLFKNYKAPFAGLFGVKQFDLLALNMGGASLLSFSDSWQKAPPARLAKQVNSAITNTTTITIMIFRVKIGKTSLSLIMVKVKFNFSCRIFI